MKGLRKLDKNKDKKKIGVITGSGPESGIDLWTKILKANKEYLGKAYSGDIDAPHLIIYSIPALGSSMDIQHHEELIWNYLKEAVVEISEKVDFFCIVCNTLHYYEDKILKMNLKAEFVSMIDVTINYIKSKNIKYAALLGVKSVTDLGKWSPYVKLKKNIVLEEISKDDKQKLDDLVKNIKKFSNDPSYTEELRNLINHLKSENILLACTELPLLKIKNANRNLIDVTELLAKELINKINQ